MHFKGKKAMELSFLLLIGTCSFVFGQDQQQLQPEFRQLNDEPQFTPPLPLNNVPQQPQFNRFQQLQNRQLQPQAQAQQQQPNFQQNFQQQQPQQNFQQKQQVQPQVQQQQQPQQNQNFQDFAAFRPQQNEVLPTLPPVFIPPNTPIGPAPNPQSPIRNLFRQPSNSNTFSISNIISRFLNLFNLNSN